MENKDHPKDSKDGGMTKRSISHVTNINGSPSSESQSQKKQYVCKLCRSKFRNMDDLKMHWMNHLVLNETYLCESEKNDSPTRPKSDDQGLKTVPRIKHTCKRCGEVFLRDDQLRRHMDGHLKKSQKRFLEGFEDDVLLSKKQKKDSNNSQRRSDSRQGKSSEKERPPKKSLSMDNEKKEIEKHEKSISKIEKPINRAEKINEKGEKVTEKLIDKEKAVDKEKYNDKAEKVANKAEKVNEKEGKTIAKMIDKEKTPEKKDDKVDGVSNQRSPKTSPVTQSKRTTAEQKNARDVKITDHTKDKIEHKQHRSPRDQQKKRKLDDSLVEATSPVITKEKSIADRRSHLDRHSKDTKRKLEPERKDLKEKEIAEEIQRESRSKKDHPDVNKAGSGKVKPKKMPTTVNHSARVSEIPKDASGMESPTIQKPTNHPENILKSVTVAPETVTEDLSSEQVKTKNSGQEILSKAKGGKQVPNKAPNKKLVLPLSDETKKLQNQGKETQVKGPAVANDMARIEENKEKDVLLEPSTNQKFDGAEANKNGAKLQINVPQDLPSDPKDFDSKESDPSSNNSGDGVKIQGLTCYGLSEDSLQITKACRVVIEQLELQVSKEHEECIEGDEKQKEVFVEERLTRSGVRIFKCEVCSKVFRVEAHRNRHQADHAKSRKRVKKDAAGYQNAFTSFLSGSSSDGNGEPSKKDNNTAVLGLNNNPLTATKSNEECSTSDESIQDCPISNGKETKQTKPKNLQSVAVSELFGPKSNKQPVDKTRKTPTEHKILAGKTRSEDQLNKNTSTKPSVNRKTQEHVANRTERETSPEPFDSTIEEVPESPINLRSETKTATVAQGLKCQFCSEEFQSPIHRLWHVRKFHRRPFQDDEVLPNSNLSTPVNKALQNENQLLVDKPFMTHSKPCDGSVRLPAQPTEVVNEPQNQENMSRLPQELHGSVTRIIPKNFPCLLCSKICSSAYHLKRHLSAHNKMKKGAMKKLEQKAPPNTNRASFGKERPSVTNHPIGNMIPPTNQTQLVCGICEVSFKMISDMESHMNTHRIQQNENASMDDEANLGRLLEGQPKESSLSPGLSKVYHHCEVCYRVFNRIEHYQQHMKLHLKASVITCSQCQETFFKAIDYLSHTTSSCPMASAIFPQAAEMDGTPSLVAHVKQEQPEGKRSMRKTVSPQKSRSVKGGEVMDDPERKQTLRSKVKNTLS